MTEKNTEQSNSTKPRRWMVLVWGILFFLLIDIGVRIYFMQPDLLSRNIDRGIGALPYMLDQMDKYKGKKIAWIGASVLQGYQNVSADRTFPALVERNLRRYDEYKDVKSFNLAAAGHNFGDHYCILEEAIRHDPDVIVMAIHFKSFSQHVTTSIPIQHKSMVAFLAGDPNRKEMLKRFSISPVDYWLYRLDWATRKLSGFYRYHDLITQMVTKSADPPAYVIEDYYREAAGFFAESRSVARAHDYEDRSTDYLWKLLPEALIVKNHQICANLDFSDSNRNWRTFKDVCKLGREKKVNMVFYLTPINRAIVEEKQFFDWDMLRGYKQVVIKEVRGNGHLLADTSNAVDSAFFSDTDHLNMNGHAQISKKMTRDVKKALDRKQWKAPRKKRHKD